MKLATVCAVLLSCLLAPTAALADSTVYRVDTLELRDPHVFAGAFLICLDATANVNEQMAGRVIADGDQDGLIDLSLVVKFPSFDPAAAQQSAELHVADCTAPLSSSVCSPGEFVAVTEATNTESGVCLAPHPGTLSGYSPTPNTPTNACFATQPEPIVVDIAGISIALESAQVAASFASRKEDGLVSGLLSGFVSEQTAENTFVPDHIPFVGGKSLASLLKGGRGVCESGDDRDIGPDGSRGWWMYFDFTAAPVDWNE